jgi:hypothetical protein
MFWFVLTSLEARSVVLSTRLSFREHLNSRSAAIRRVQMPTAFLCIQPGAALFNNLFFEGHIEQGTSRRDFLIVHDVELSAFAEVIALFAVIFLPVIRPLQFGLRPLELFAYAIKIALNVSPTAFAIGTLSKCRLALLFAVPELSRKRNGLFPLVERYRCFISGCFILNRLVSNNLR